MRMNRLMMVLRGGTSWISGLILAFLLTGCGDDSTGPGDMLAVRGTVTGFVDLAAEGGGIIGRLGPNEAGFSISVWVENQGTRAQSIVGDGCLTHSLVTIRSVEDSSTVGELENTGCIGGWGFSGEVVPGDSIEVVTVRYAWSALLDESVSPGVYSVTVPVNLDSPALSRSVVIGTIEFMGF